ncbi:S41 family peptidase [Lacinutrix jangbogonensis]|uniref:S41 family peptidase n=1 Tax=Lacinutrix jangbogonensis TaxID=1469557 RepID=UPI00068FB2E1|nr:S41 family peptidase [Lacinutrix jangbogonensis]
MKNVITLNLLFFFGIACAFAQTETCDCKTDLDFIVTKMKKMPSYKKQIKGDKKAAFETSYKSLSSKMKQPIPLEACYKMLLQQMLLVNDVHSSLKFVSKYITKEDSKDDAKLIDFKASEKHINHPKTNLNLEALKSELALKKPTDLDGLYKYGDQQTIGIYYAENKKDLIGIVLESNLKQWTAGEVIFEATHTNGIKYNLFYYHPATRTPGFVKSISFENGRLWSYKKIGNTANAELPIENQTNWEFKQLTPETQYMYFGDFSSFSTKNKKAFKRFYADMETKLTAKNVIVDLRSNAGGNSKLSDPFLKLLKNKNVYILTNCFAGSNGEQFTLKLKALKNAKHLGQTTRGIIAYGMNYGYNYNTPSGYFNMTPTDMNFSKYLAFEGKGVSPEYPLDFNTDWIEQTLKMIETDNN